MFTAFFSHNTERTQWDHPLLVKTMEELGEIVDTILNRLGPVHSEQLRSVCLASFNVNGIVQISGTRINKM